MHRTPHKKKKVEKFAALHQTANPLAANILAPLSAMGSPQQTTNSPCCSHPPFALSGNRPLVPPSWAPDDIDSNYHDYSPIQSYQNTHPNAKKHVVFTRKRHDSDQSFLDCEEVGDLRPIQKAAKPCFEEPVSSLLTKVVDDLKQIIQGGTLPQTRSLENSYRQNTSLIQPALQKVFSQLSTENQDEHKHRCLSKKTLHNVYRSAFLYWCQSYTTKKQGYIAVQNANEIWRAVLTSGSCGHGEPFCQLWMRFLRASNTLFIMRDTWNLFWDFWLEFEVHCEHNHCLVHQTPALPPHSPHHSQPFVAPLSSQFAMLDFAAPLAVAQNLPLGAAVQFGQPFSFAFAQPTDPNLHCEGIFVSSRSLNPNQSNNFQNNQSNFQNSQSNNFQNNQNNNFQNSQSNNFQNNQNNNFQNNQSNFQHNQNNNFQNNQKHNFQTQNCHNQNNTHFHQNENGTNNNNFSIYQTENMSLCQTTALSESHHCTTQPISQKIPPSISHCTFFQQYDFEAAWPSLFDNFVLWVQKDLSKF